MAKRQKTEKTAVRKSNESEEDWSDASDSEFERSQSDSDGIEFDNDEFEDELDIEENAESNAADDPFASAMTSILDSRVKAHDRENPIMIRNRRKAREIEESKLEAKAKRELRKEKISQQDRAHVTDLVSKDSDVAGKQLQHEKILRKTAQRGVIRLFNAINASQNAAGDAEASIAGDVHGLDKKAQKVTEVSKDKFLDMIRSG